SDLVPHGRDGLMPKDRGRGEGPPSPPLGPTPAETCRGRPRQNRGGPRAPRDPAETRSPARLAAPAADPGGALGDGRVHRGDRRRPQGEEAPPDVQAGNPDDPEPSPPPAPHRRTEGRRGSPRRDRTRGDRLRELPVADHLHPARGVRVDAPDQGADRPMPHVRGAPRPPSHNLSDLRRSHALTPPTPGSWAPRPAPRRSPP